MRLVFERVLLSGTSDLDLMTVNDEKIVAYTGLQSTVSGILNMLKIAEDIFGLTCYATNSEYQQK